MCTNPGCANTSQRGYAFAEAACLAGALAGAYWGIGSIPREWLEGMRGRELVQPLVDRLVAGVEP